MTVLPRSASTLGGIAIYSAVVLLFIGFWDLGMFLQVAIVSILPLFALGCAEFLAVRERKCFLVGSLAFLAFGSFVMNLMLLRFIFNINSLEHALIAWGAFATVVAYRYGLRLLLAIGLLLLIAYAAAEFNAGFGHPWFEFGERPELVAVLGVLVFCAPIVVRHQHHQDFPPVYRLVGAIVFFLCVLLTEWGGSYLPLGYQSAGRLYGFVGLLTSAGATWLGITQHWNSLVNISATAFTIFLFLPLWDWMPNSLFLAAIGAPGIAMAMVMMLGAAGIAMAMVMMLKRLRGRMARKGVLP
jgi:hypothetical protein